MGWKCTLTRIMPFALSTSSSAIVAACLVSLEAAAKASKVLKGDHTKRATTCHASRGSLHGTRPLGAMAQGPFLKVDSYVLNEALGYDMLDVLHEPTWLR